MSKIEVKAWAKLNLSLDVAGKREDGYHELTMLALKYLPVLGNRGASLNQQMKDKLVEHKQYIREYGVDMPEVVQWKWHK